MDPNIPKAGGEIAGETVRILPKPNQSILLLGPRGTGKSTWIRQNFPEATTYDLLNTQEALRLSKDPSSLYREVQALPSQSWVVLDEVQKVPTLLDEVHRLIEQKKVRFVLSGSSARKLKRGGANLLAGRALMTSMFPFVSREVGTKTSPEKICSFGLLPAAFLAEDPVSYLTTYAGTYLQEEIKEEALTRDIGGFARFLEIAARQNAQVTNVSNISRDAQVGRKTAQGYFDILIDTLIGSWLLPWKLKRATKQVAHPKFYFFDPGVVRALSGRLPYPPSSEEMGPLFETYILHEIRAYLAYRKLHYEVFFWNRHQGLEVDIVCETQSGFVILEIKCSRQWAPSFNKGLLTLSEELGPTKTRAYGVYTGERSLQDRDVSVFPFQEFLKKIWEGEII